MMPTRFIAASIAVAAVFVLSGCADGGSPENDKAAGGQSGYLFERTITLRDNRTVTCVVYAAGYKGGVSCDWDNAK